MCQCSVGLDFSLNCQSPVVSKGHLFGAHFCYKMADVEFEGYGCPVTRYSLLGVGPQEIQFGGFPTLDQLAMTLVSTPSCPNLSQPVPTCPTV